MRSESAENGQIVYVYELPIMFAIDTLHSAENAEYKKGESVHES